MVEHIHQKLAREVDALELPLRHKLYESRGAEYYRKLSGSHQ